MSAIRRAPFFPPPFAGEGGEPSEPGEGASSVKAPLPSPADAGATLSR